MTTAVFVLKIFVVLFFGYISFAAFQKSRKHKRDMANERFNRHVLESLSRKELRKGLVYAVITLAAFSTLFIKTVIE